MKSVSAALLGHLGQDGTTLAVLWKVIRQDRVVLGFTTHDRDIVYQGTTYAAATGFTNSASAAGADMSVDNMEVTGFLDSSAISERDVRAHLYDYAQIEIRIVNWANLAQGDLKLRSGTIGVIKMVNGIFQAEIRGLTQRLTTILGSIYGPVCRAELGSGTVGYSGDSGIDTGNHYLCNLDLSLFRQFGSVQSSPDAMTIVPAPGLVQRSPFISPQPVAPAGWFNDGILTFTSGPMKGISVEIKSWDGTTLNLSLPMPFQPNGPSSGTSDNFGPPVSLLLNGGFENGLANWTAGSDGDDPATPSPSSVQVHSGRQSCLLGKVSGAPEPNGESFIFQDIAIPAQAAIATLDFWYWPSMDDAAGDDNDWQECQIRTPSDGFLKQAFLVSSNARSWQHFTFDLTPWIGHTIRIWFSVTEDGFGDMTYMYLDDVQVTYAPGIRGTPPTPGDRFTIEPGCNRLTSDCQGKFQNIVNFRAEPFIPGPQLLLSYPDAKN